MQNRSRSTSCGTSLVVRGCSYNQRKLNNVLSVHFFSDHKLLVRQECSRGTPLLTSDPQNGSRCRHKDPVVSGTANFSSTKKLVCSFHFRDEKPTDENNTSEHAPVYVSSISYIMPPQTISEVQTPMKDLTHNRTWPKST